MIEWSSQYETGINSIDEQHKELIRITGRLSDLLINAVDGDDIYDEMVEIINALTQYTVYHFNYEEELLRKHDYELIESHVKEHTYLIDYIENMDLRAVDEDQITYGKKILKFLISWIFKHISGSDFLYKDMLIQKGVK